MNNHNHNDNYNKLFMSSLLLLTSMLVVIGSTCPPTICTEFFYWVRHLFLLQSTTRVITECDSFFITMYDKSYYKVRQLFSYKVRRMLLQSVAGITKCDSFLSKSCDNFVTKCATYISKYDRTTDHLHHTLFQLVELSKVNRSKQVNFIKAKKVLEIYRPRSCILQTL